MAAAAVLAAQEHKRRKQFYDEEMRKLQGEYNETAKSPADTLTQMLVDRDAAMAATNDAVDSPQESDSSKLPDVPVEIDSPEEVPQNVQPMTKGEGDSRSSIIDGMLHKDPLLAAKELQAKARQQLEDKWAGMMAMGRAIGRGQKPSIHTNKLKIMQNNLREAYHGYTCQVLVASLIFFNFLVNVVESQILAEEGSEISEIFFGFEIFFTIVFTFELLTNMTANWFRPFWMSGWNLFDFVVVFISLLSMFLSNVSGIATLRLLRAFRVFRLFKRLESLRKIISGLEQAIPGCSNAFFILILITAIYAILGKDFFGEIHPYFKVFSAAFFTLFQVMTGDSWAEAVARPIIDEYPHASLYFISYILITSVMLVNVVVAVLLEKIVSTEEADEEVQVAEADKQNDVKFLPQHAAWICDVPDKQQVVDLILSRVQSLQEAETARQEENQLKFEEEDKARKKIISAAWAAKEAELAEKALELQNLAGGGNPEELGVVPEEETKPKKKLKGIWKYQKLARRWYNSNLIQFAIAFVIFLNFILNAVEAQYVVVPDDMVTVFTIFEDIFTVIFTVELSLNMYAHWCWKFWSSGWNIFDFLVVTVSLLARTLAGIPGITQLRLVRAFRVFRLVKRFKALRIILLAIEQALPGCANAAAILVLVTSIYAILGVEFFRTFDSSSSSDYFLNFTSAFFSLFQVLTGDSWAEVIARPFIDEVPWSVIYFVSYILVAGVMLMNIVIAVLLEKIANVTINESDKEEEEKLKAMKDAVTAKHKEHERTTEEAKTELEAPLPIKAETTTEEEGEFDEDDDEPEADEEEKILKKSGEARMITDIQKIRLNLSGCVDIMTSRIKGAFDLEEFDDPVQTGDPTLAEAANSVTHGAKPTLGSVDNTLPSASKWQEMDSI